MEPTSPAPARKVVSRSPARTVRRLNLPTIFGRPIECESTLERDFVWRAALCPGLIDLRGQPFRLELPSGHKYTPDFLAVYADGSRAVVEVKLDRNVKDYRSIFDEARAELQKRQIQFLVLTELQIRREAIHEKAALLLRFRKVAVDPEAQHRVIKCLAYHPEGMAIATLQHQADVHRLDVLGLAASRAIRVTKSIEIDETSLVFPVCSKEKPHEIYFQDWFDAALW